MSFNFYNTLGRKMQPFEPIIPGKAGFYGCGPTVYNYAHIGNLRAYVHHDVLVRSLRRAGFEVHHVMNITDVGHLSDDADDGEDKMVKSAEERGKSVLEIAQFYTDAFFKDTDRLNITRPTIVCKATDHIQEMIELIQRIEKNGYTYFAGGNLYFDISRFPKYGELALLKLDDLKAGARIETDENKRNPHDFVLWFTKSKFENQALVWDSPWGRGYPGWHIECSAMSMKYLGEQFDIHAGGIDHIPIHHTNEIAQSEAATGKSPWVKYWVHNEFLVMDKGKMSKSAGGFLTLQKLIDDGYDPLDYRYFLLGAHYRSQLQFSYESLQGAKNARKSLVEKVRTLSKGKGKREQGTMNNEQGAVSSEQREGRREKGKGNREQGTMNNEQGAVSSEQREGSNPQSQVPSPKSQVPSGCRRASDLQSQYIDEFNRAIQDDLNTPRALAALWGLLKDAPASQETMEAVFDMDRVLGLRLEEAVKEGQNINIDEEFAREIEELIAKRAEAKKAKDFVTADSIRQNLKDRGIILEDGPNGAIWKTGI